MSFRIRLSSWVFSTLLKGALYCFPFSRQYVEESADQASHTKNTFRLKAHAENSLNQIRSPHRATLSDRPSLSAAERRFYLGFPRLSLLFLVSFDKHKEIITSFRSSQFSCDSATYGCVRSVTVSSQISCDFATYTQSRVSCHITIYHE